MSSRTSAAFDGGLSRNGGRCLTDSGDSAFLLIRLPKLNHFNFSLNNTLLVKKLSIV
jgi:hypothetical protein